MNRSLPAVMFALTFATASAATFTVTNTNDGRRREPTPSRH